jgi:hypothetical protein
VILLLPACAPLEFVTDKPAGEPVAEDSVDETDTASSDTAPPHEPLCAREVPEDVSVGADAACAQREPFDDLLVTAWEVPGWATMVSTTRVEDGNGDGRIDAGDPMQVWIDWVRDGQGRASLHRADGTLMFSMSEYSDGVTVAADLDAGRPGGEVAYFESSTGQPAWHLSDEGGTYQSTDLDVVGGMPIVYDLDGDGEPQVVMSNAVLAADGATEAIFPSGFATQRFAVGDVDRDGVAEVVTVDESRSVRWRSPDGVETAVCEVGEGSWTMGALAIGQLDGDPDAEALAASDTDLLICDPDGTILAQATLPGDAMLLLAIAQLDADEEPELLLEAYTVLVAYEHDLSEKWRRESRSGGLPFSVADLDGDGMHEILVTEDGGLWILDGEGQVLQSVPSDGSCSSTLGQPVVADVDADGRAEILALGCDAVRMFESPAGGWLVRDADRPWPGPDHHPDLQGVAGDVLPPSAWWDRDGGNVWQGLRAGPLGSPDLAVGAIEVCLDCGYEAVVTVRVDNTGVDDLVDGAEVVVLAADDGAELGRAPLVGLLGPGVGRHVSVSVPVERVASGLVARVETDATVCGRASAELTWAGEACP